MEGPGGRRQAEMRRWQEPEAEKNCYGIAGRQRKNKRDGHFRMTVEG